MTFTKEPIAVKFAWSPVETAWHAADEDEPTAAAAALATWSPRLCAREDTGMSNQSGSNTPKRIRFQLTLVMPIFNLGCQLNIQAGS
ncbi:hypothetical protein GGD70_007774 [Paraburkholderia fungorum]|nr:hypothetical protein [Paraburkholderia fungorum]